MHTSSMRRNGHFEGHWWFPGIAETGASGALECGGEITLTLHGLVLTENQKWIMQLESIWPQGVKALGESLGRSIVLREVHLLSHSDSGESRFWVSTALVGTSTLDSERESYGRVTIQNGLFNRVG